MSAGRPADPWTLNSYHISRGYIGYILGLYHIGIMEKKMETTIMGYIGPLFVDLLESGSPGPCRSSRVSKDFKRKAL